LSRIGRKYKKANMDFSQFLAGMGGGGGGAGNGAAAK